MSPQKRKDVLEARAIEKSFGGFWGAPRVRVLRGASLSVSRSEVVVISATNGAGKSTFLKICAHLLLPEAGTVELLGVPLSARSRRLVGFCSGDEQSFFLRLTARENLRFHARLFGVSAPAATERIDELTERLQVRPWLDRPVAQSSAGIRARLGLARALLHRPQLLLLDEPTKSQDEEGRDLICAAMRHHCSLRNATLVVSHDASLASRLNARRVSLSAGVLEPTPC